MENNILFKIEIFLFLISFLYILYFSICKTYKSYHKVKEIVKPKKINNKKTALNKVNLDKKPKKSKKVKKLSIQNKQKLGEIIKRVKVNSSKGYYDTARNLIVEGLSLDNHDKELNLELASIYEKEKNYLNAEYIYKDLLEVFKVDFVIMKKLAYIYAMQNKLEESYKMYEDIHNKKMSDDEVIDMLSEISFNLKKYKNSLKYINLFLKSKPRNVEKMFMKIDCLNELGKVTETMEILKRILELQPYNTKAKKLLAKLKEKLIIAEK